MRRERPGRTPGQAAFEFDTAPSTRTNSVVEGVKKTAAAPSAHIARLTDHQLLSPLGCRPEAARRDWGLSDPLSSDDQQQGRSGDYFPETGAVCG
jgi:hypothetical protein